MKIRFVKFVRRQKGFEALQAVLLLGAAFFVIMGLNQIWNESGKGLVGQSVSDTFAGKTSPISGKSN